MPAGPEGVLVAATVLDSPPRVAVEGPADPPAAAGSEANPWYLRRDVQAEVGASHAVLRALGAYSGSLIEACSSPGYALHAVLLCWLYPATSLMMHARAQYIWQRQLHSQSRPPVTASSTPNDAVGVTTDIAMSSVQPVCIHNRHGPLPQRLTSA